MQDPMIYSAQGMAVDAQSMAAPYRCKAPTDLVCRCGQGPRGLDAGAPR